jgi:hypothetical protein
MVEIWVDEVSRFAAEVRLTPFEIVDIADPTSWGG